MKKRDSLIKNIYLYLVTFVGIVISVIGSITLIDLGLKTYVFTTADTYINYPQPRMVKEGINELPEIDTDKQLEYHQKELSSKRQRQAANAIAMLVVGFPLYYYHWSLLQKKSA